MMTDPIADMLSRIRNATMAHHDRVEVPRSKIKESIANLLKQEGFVSDVRASETPATFTVVLKYGRGRESALSGIKRRSRPGRRVYVGHSDIPMIQNGLGVAILSTSHGIVTDRQARSMKIGGELLCEVW
jgi:small subunit ribosomal protein S8